MKTIKGLLTRFKNLQAPDRVVKSAIIDAVREVLGIDITGSATIKTNDRGCVFLNTNSSIKTAIFENKHQILSRVNNILGKDQLRDIK